VDVGRPGGFPDPILGVGLDARGQQQAEDTEEHVRA
jgi:hypothetical protein